MIGYVLRKLLTAVPLVLLVSLIAFGLVYILPGDATVAILGAEAPQKLRDQLRVQLGLDQSLFMQYLRWFGDFLRGDLGTSLITGENIVDVIRQRMPVTVELITLTMLVSLIIGVPLGVVAARSNGGFIDLLTSSVALFGLSIPNFWLGMLLILAAQQVIPQLSISGFTPMNIDWKRNLLGMVLPVMTTSLREVGFLARFTRNSMVEVLQEDYTRTATAKGLPRVIVFYKHALRNALVPVITVSGLQIASLLSGLVIAETIFVLPGLGKLILDSILTRDTPVLLATSMLIAVLVVLINLVVDLLYVAVDPRIKAWRAA